MAFKIGDKVKGEETTKKFSINTKHLQEGGKNILGDILCLYSIKLLYLVLSNEKFR